MIYFVFAAALIAAAQSYTYCTNSTQCEQQHGIGYFCNDTTATCESTYCTHDNNCTGTDICNDYMGMICVPGCTTDAYCSSLFYYKPICNTTSMKCEEENCLNSAGYCDSDGPGYYCTTYGTCDYTYCYMDAECNIGNHTNNTNVCNSNHMRCVPNCNNETSTWCADAFSDPYYSCDGGHCLEKQCNNSSDCPTDYVCADDSRCVRSCLNNDTYCTNELGYEPEYFCQASGSCETVSCATQLDCAPDNACNGDICSPWCDNDADCRNAARNSNYKCATENYCIYRECYNNTDCTNGDGWWCDDSSLARWECKEPNCMLNADYCRINYGLGYVCDNATNSCESTYCYQDDECNQYNGRVCNYNWMQCVPSCVNEDSTWCADAFSDEYLSCNGTDGQCGKLSCDVINNNSDCPTDYVCKESSSAGWSACALACNNDTYCAQQYNDESYKCQSDGICARDYCNLPLISCTDSGYMCNVNDECVPGCTNSTECVQAPYWDPNWKCGENNYCVYRECYNDTECQQRNGNSRYICNSTLDENWHCEIPDCDDNNDCSGTDICDNYMNSYCVDGCTNDTYCYSIFYGMKPICNTASMECEQENCANTAGYCSNMGRGYFCNNATGNCEYTYCQNDNNCTGTDFCDYNSRCVPGCTNDTYCDSVFYDKPICDTDTMKCQAENCVNSASYCDDHGYGPGAVCNNNTGYCESTYCTYDWECSGSYICSHNWGECVPSCVNQDSTWCADAFYDPYSSCNGTNGNCREKECNVSNNNSDCPTDYVCDDIYDDGWARCGRSCLNNDTYCMQRSNQYGYNYDESYKCQSDGICARDTCNLPLITCTNSEYTCSTNNECVPGCTNNTACAKSNNYDYRWECGVNNYCVFRECSTDAHCRSMNGPSYSCDTTDYDNYYCTSNYCHYDSNCSSSQVCDHSMGSCIDDCSTHSSVWCADTFNYKYLSCNGTGGHCWEKPCNGSSSDCPLDYVCRDDEGWARCARSCANNDTYCAQQYNYDESYKCQSDGICARDYCNLPLISCTESGYTCNVNECVPGCTNNTECLQAHYWDHNWKCGENNYCVYRECHNDTECQFNYGSHSICNTTKDDNWFCEITEIPYCDDDNDCQSDQFCDHYRSSVCVAGCTNNTYCAWVTYSQKPICDTDSMRCEAEHCGNSASYCDDYGYLPGSVCNHTTGYCESTYCYDDTKCSGGNICNQNWMLCVPSCFNQDSTWCADAFNDPYSLCNGTNGNCREKECFSNDNSDCPTDYVCDLSDYDWRCTRSCLNNDTYCKQRYNYDESYKCQWDGICARDTCDPLLNCTDSTYVCTDNYECVPGCVNNSDCSELYNWDSDWKCGDMNYCIYRQCHNDTECGDIYGSNYVCNMNMTDDWFCEEQFTQSCNGDYDCLQYEMCDIFNTNECVPGCYMDDECNSLFPDYKTVCNMTTMRCEEPQSTIFTTAEIHSTVPIYTTQSSTDTSDAGATTADIQSSLQTTDTESVTTTADVELESTESMTTTEAMMGSSTTEIQTTDNTCVSNATDGICFEAGNSGKCKKTVSSLSRIISRSKCDLCGKIQSKCECATFLTATLETFIKSELSNWLQSRFLAHCWKSDECWNIDHVSVVGQSSCTCASFECIHGGDVFVGSVQGDSDEVDSSEIDTSSEAVQTHCIRVAVCIGFVFYIMQFLSFH